MKKLLQLSLILCFCVVAILCATVFFIPEIRLAQGSHGQAYSQLFNERSETLEKILNTKKNSLSTANSSIIYSYFRDGTPVMAYGDRLVDDSKFYKIEDTHEILHTSQGDVYDTVRTSSGQWFFAVSFQVSLSEIRKKNIADGDIGLRFQKPFTFIFMYDENVGILKQLYMNDSDVLRDGVAISVSNDEQVVKMAPYYCQEACDYSANPTLVYDIQNQQLTKLESVSDFEWLPDGGYKYKQYIERPCTTEERKEHERDTYPFYGCIFDPTDVEWITVSQ